MKCLFIPGDSDFDVKHCHRFWNVLSARPLHLFAVVKRIVMMECVDWC